MSAEVMRCTCGHDWSDHDGGRGVCLERDRSTPCGCQAHRVRPAPRPMESIREDGRKRKALRSVQLAPGSVAQNSRGEWVPAIPEPLFLAWGRVRCGCGEKFRGRKRFRGHYALAHILGLE